MKVWQYFVAIVVVLGCSKEPLPEDSYFITQNSYSDSSGVSAPADTTVSLVLPDTNVVVDSISFSEDSLVLPADSLITVEDSLDTELPSDSIQFSVPSENWRFAEIEIQGSLYQSLACITDVQSDILGAHCVRNFVWEMNPWRGFIAGDSVRIIYTVEELPRENMVVALEYVPVEGSSNSAFSCFVFTRAGDNWPSVWLPDGTELVKLLDRMPVGTFEEITSVYGEPRGNHTHQGIDFKAPAGTPVVSVTGGTVVRTNWNTNYNGYCIELDFGGYSELFLHLQSIESGIIAGASVQPGDQVGMVGNTGISTAPHLHYQINGPDDYSIDPYLYFSSHRRTLGADDMILFQQHVESCRAMMGV